MAAASKLGGYSLAQADLLRRAMGKKDKKTMAKERTNFIQGCVHTNKIPEKKANAIFDLLEKFAGYGFNKSHSAAYGVISYHTAYLKAHYPVEFMAGLLSNEINNTDKISIFVGECKRMGISIVPPDINRSGLKFTPESQDGKMAIRYGLAAIKNVGEAAMEMSIQERERAGEYTSLEDFCGRIGTRIANRKMLESLIKAGAFDFVGRDRADLFACIDESLSCAAAAQRDRTVGQVSLFDEETHAATTRKRIVTPWSDHEKLSYEKELLGFYVSGHPLDAYADLFASKNYQPISSLGDLDDRSQFRIGGAIVQVEKKFTRREGKPFAVMWVEDRTGTLEVVVWNDVYVVVSEILVPGRVVEVRGTIDTRGDSLRATAQKIRVPSANKANGASNGNAGLGEATARPERSTRLRDATAGQASAESEPAVLLQFSPATTKEELREVRELLESSPGRRRVQLLFDRPSGEPLRVDAGADLCVELTSDLEQKLVRWLVTTKAERRGVPIEL
jgi:DNA polymerase-3 subunit alpha